jgi:ATP synthase protein I
VADKKSQTDGKDLADAIHVKEKRKLKARNEKDRGVWFGLGMFGMVGWSVAVPTLVAVFFGIWIDKTSPGRYSWTLMFLVIGVAIGCLNAWYWIKRESRRE